MNYRYLMNKANNPKNHIIGKTILLICFLEFFKMRVSFFPQKTQNFDKESGGNPINGFDN